jgi:hypothetical protein
MPPEVGTQTPESQVTQIEPTTPQTVADPEKATVNPLLDEHWLGPGQSSELLATEAPAATPAQETPEAQGAPATETDGTPEESGNVPSLLLGRFKSADELVDAYRNLESHYTQQSQVLAHLGRQVEQLVGNQQQPQTQIQPPQEEPGFDYEGFLEKVRYEDPKEAGKALAEFVAGQAEQVFRAHQEQQAHAQQAQQQAAARYQQELEALPDLEQLKPAMGKILQERPHLANLPDVVEVIANMARAGLAPRETPAPAQDWRKQALSDPEIERQILLRHQQRIQAGEKPPVLIGNQPSGGAPSTAPNKPKTLAEATRAFLAQEGAH